MHDPLPIERLRRALGAWGLQSADVIGITPGATADVFLVMQGRDRWVAKLNYAERDYFEIGLRASLVVRRRVGDASFDVAVPVATSSDALTEQIEWPDGQEHPLALLTYVAGDPIPAGLPSAAQLVGDVCGRVHAALQDVGPADVGVRALPDGPDVDGPDREAGRFAWLHETWRELEQRAWAARGEVRQAISVWDGPDIRCRPGGIGLLDFGHCGWHSIVHVVANRSLSVGMVDDSRVTSFLDAVERHLPLSAAEHAQLPLHRARNLAIYARWVATEKVARRDDAFNDRWFRQLLDALCRELPGLGLSMPDDAP